MTDKISKTIVSQSRKTNVPEETLNILNQLGVITINTVVLETHVSYDTMMMGVSSHHKYPKTKWLPNCADGVCCDIAMMGAGK